MKTEMDLLHLDERQRLAWLLANRGTLIAVGAVWIGMIVWFLAHSRMPLFLILMVPVFGLLRVGLFLYFCRTPLDLGGQSRRSRIARTFKIGAALLLGLSLLLPLYSFGGTAGEATAARGTAGLGYSWHVVHNNWPAAIVLAVAFLWPMLTLGLSRESSGRRQAIAALLLEPLLAVLSVLIVLWIPQLTWELQTLWIFPVGLVSARPEIGCYLAVVANGIYIVTLLSELLRP